MTDLHLQIEGEGDTVVFVHGTWAWGNDTFPHQRALADRVRIVLVDRRGFGRSPDAMETGWPRDAEDLSELLTELGPVHLVGSSYGAVSCLVTATRRPDLIRSLVAIEPPAFGLARGNDAADALARALEPVYTRARDLAAEEFAREWGAALGRSEERHQELISSFTPEDWAAAEASRRERWPGDAPIDLDALASADFTTLALAGGWNPKLFPGAERVGRAFRAVCETLRDRSGARLEVFENSSHNPQVEEPDRFNDLLRDLWFAT